eukprot:jgi/Phyca11/547958/estExt2_Genewise1Plus.C_PHYCAscaffold_270134
MTPNDKLIIQQQVKSQWNVQPSNVSKRCTSSIQKIVDNIRKPEKNVQDLIPLSLGGPTVFGNLHCPEVLVEAVVRNTRSMKHNRYIHSAGSEEAHAAVAKRYSSSKAPLTPDDILITSGCSGAIDIALRGLLNPGDNILHLKPGFPFYQTLCAQNEFESRFYNLMPECNWEAELEHMQFLANEKTKAILVNNPSNPCGSVYSKPHLEEILALTEFNKIPVVAVRRFSWFVNEVLKDVRST